MKKKICIILIAAFVALFSTSAYFIFDHYRQDKQQAELYDSLADMVDSAADAEVEPEEPILYTEEKTVLPELAELYQQNGDLAGWIRIEDTNINYPVMHTPNKTVVRPHESREHKRSIAIDPILTGKYTAIPCFIGIMAFVFSMTFNFIGAALSDLMAMGVDTIVVLLDNLLTKAEINTVVHSLVIDGICSGVGSVLSFLPTIVTLFFFLSILEDTGYMARVAFVMDRLLRKIGLSGRSIVPMLIGFGCSVPAIMATRTLSSERDRKMTILLTPFMSCTAKLPIYSMMVGAFFERKYQALVMIGFFGQANRSVPMGSTNLSTLTITENGIRYIAGSLLQPTVYRRGSR